MNDHERRTKTEQRARQLFDASVEGLDGETRSRLNRARQAAVAEAVRRRSPAWRIGLPAVAAASIALVAVMLWRMPAEVTGPTARDSTGAPSAAVVELLATSEGLEVASEDPEFYAWLESRDLPAPDGSG